MFQRIRKSFDPEAPAPLPGGYRYQVQPLHDKTGPAGLVYTLYGPPGHEGVAHDWLVENVIGLEALAASRRREPGRIVKFRYIEEG